MEVIYKYELDAVPEQTFSLPAFAQILSVQCQGEGAGVPVMWVRHTLNTSAMVDRTIVVLPTGLDFDVPQGYQYKHIETIQMSFMVWHFFEKVKV